MLEEVEQELARDDQNRRNLEAEALDEYLPKSGGFEAAMVCEGKDQEEWIGCLKVAERAFEGGDLVKAYEIVKYLVNLGWLKFE